MKEIITACFMFDEGSLEYDWFKINEEIKQAFIDHIVARNKMPIKFDVAMIPGDVERMIQEYDEEAQGVSHE